MKKKSLLIALVIIVADAAAVLYFWQGKGHLALTSPGAELQLRGLFSSTVVIRSDSGPQKVAARVYRPSQLTLTGGRDGDTWQLQSQGPWNGLGKITVLPGKTTTVTLGAPLVIKPRASAGSQRGFVDFGLYGQAGEKYSNVITRNGRRITAPAVRILDEQGNVLASGQFGYG